MSTPILAPDSKRQPSPIERRYTLFGETLSSTFPFESHLASSTSPPDFSFNCNSETTSPVETEDLDPAYRSPYRDESGNSILVFYRGAHFDVMRFPDVADFALRPSSIECHLLDPARSFLVELRLLGPVLAARMELAGHCVLHCAVIVIDGHAVGFLSAHGAGKTTLAASLMEQGCELLSDDVLVLRQSGNEFQALPGYPQMRMHPPDAARFASSTSGLGRAHPAYKKLKVPIGTGRFGTFCPLSRPLAFIYLPERSDEPTLQISDLSARDAVIELVRYSFIAPMVAGLGLQPRRMDAFSRLVSQVPIRRIQFPTGHSNLPGVAQEILRNVRGQ